MSETTSLSSSERDSSRPRKSGKGVTVRKPKMRRGMVMTWAALAGLAAAGAVSSAVSEDGKARLMALFGQSPAQTIAANDVPAERVVAGDGAPMATGSIGDATAVDGPQPLDDVIALKTEIAQLRSALRRAQIERNALQRRLAMLQETQSDPVDEMITGSLPDVSGERPGIPSGGTIVETPEAARPAPIADAMDKAEDAIRDAMTVALQADEALDPTSITITMFGIEVGAGKSVSDLRARWERLARTHPDLLSGFEPVISLRESSTGTTLRLLAGPVSTAAEAVEMCTRLRLDGVICTAVPYDATRFTAR